jgi:hypothetical protein
MVHRCAQTPLFCAARARGTSARLLPMELNSAWRLASSAGKSKGNKHAYPLNTYSRNQDQKIHHEDTKARRKAYWLFVSWLSFVLLCLRGESFLASFFGSVLTG